MNRYLSIGNIFQDPCISRGRAARVVLRLRPSIDTATVRRGIVAHPNGISRNALVTICT